MFKNVYIFDENLLENKIVIFGTGDWAKRAFYTLLDDNINVEFFADRRVEYDFILGKRVLLEDELIGTNYMVIVASSYWKEIIERLSQKGIKNLYVMNRFAMNPTGIEI